MHSLMPESSLHRRSQQTGAHRSSSSSRKMAKACGFASTSRSSTGTLSMSTINLRMTRSSMTRMRLSTSNTSASSYDDAKKREYHSVKISSVSAKETSTLQDSTSHKMITRSVPKSPKQSQSFRRPQVARISVHF